jgi:hypothetical protein
MGILCSERRKPPAEKGGFEQISMGELFGESGCI